LLLCRIAATEHKLLLVKTILNKIEMGNNEHKSFQFVYINIKYNTKVNKVLNAYYTDYHCGATNNQ